MNKYKRLLNNSIWNFLGNSGSKLISFILFPFYTKWLGTEGYGFSDLITTYSSLFGGIVTLSLSDAILIFIKNADDKKKYYSSIIGAVTTFFVIWLLLSFIFKTFGYNNGFIFENLYYILFVIITNFLQTSSQQMALALDKIKVYAFSGIIYCLLIFFFSWVLIPLYGVIGYIYAMILSNIITALYSVIMTCSWRYLSLTSIRINAILEVLKYSVPLIPNAIMWWLVSSLNRPLLENHLGLSAIGIFAVANKFPAIITMLFSIFSTSWTISVIEEYNKPKFDTFYNTVYKVLFSIIVILSLLLMLFSKWIICIFTPSEFHIAYRYMLILIISSVFSCMASYFGTCFAVVKESKYFFYSTLWGAVTAVIFNYVLIPRFAIYGAAISMLLSFFISAASRYLYSLKFVNAKVHYTTFLYSLLMCCTVLSILFIDSFVLHSIIVAVSMVIIFINSKKDFMPIYSYLTNMFYNRNR